MPYGGGPDLSDEVVVLGVLTLGGYALLAAEIAAVKILLEKGPAGSSEAALTLVGGRLLGGKGTAASNADDAVARAGKETPNLLKSVAKEGDEAFEVLDGVRRSKAADLAARAGKGSGTIGAEVIGTGGKVIDVLVSSLHSPFKSVIDTSGAGLGRCLDTLKKTFSGSKPPPILVQPGSRGPKIRDVLVE